MKKKWKALGLALSLMLFLDSPQLIAHAEANFPSSYSLVQKGLVTPVKNQSPYGTCWSFAAIACMENNAMLQGYGSYDLSEAQLGYFMFHNPKNPASGLEGDTVSYNAQGGDWYDFGGNNLLTTKLLAKGYGPTLERYVPYENITASLKDEYAFGHNIFSLQAAYVIDGNDKEGIKEAIVNYGGATMNVYMGNTKSYYNRKTASLYVSSSKERADHDVCVVGWDDNYSRENFSKSKPEKDGAWICKNSYGTGFGEDGYFWVSYEDKVTNSKNESCVAFVLRSSGVYNSVYQYDGGGSEATVQARGAANIFVARKTETIEAIQVMNNENYESATVNVYSNVTNKKPESGTKVLSQKVQFGRKGYETVALNKAIKVTKGQKFSICVKYSDTTRVCVDRDVDFGWIAYDITAREGESYCLIEQGLWTSLGTNMNVRVKALGNAVALEEQEELPSTKLKVTAIGGGVKLTWSKIAMAEGYNIYRQGSDGQFEQIASYPNGDTKSCTVKGLKPGKNYKFYVEAYGEGYKESESNIVKAAAGIYAPKNLKASSQGGVVNLRWNKSTGATQYRIYRKITTGKYELVATVGNTNVYTDRNVQIGSTYVYKIKAATSGNILSKYSPVVRVKVK